MRLNLLILSGIVILFCSLLSCNNSHRDSDSELYALYSELDAEIARSGEYEAEKNARIMALYSSIILSINAVR